MTLRPPAHGFVTIAAGCCALLAAILATAFTAELTGHSPLNTESYVRWDAYHYLAIAQEGYNFWPAGEEAPGTWWGNVGWLPGYPLLIRALASLGLDATAAGITISHAAFLALLVVLFHVTTLHWSNTSRSAPFWVLIAAVLFPGSVYFHAVYPMSMFVLCALLALICLDRQRPLTAGILGAVAAFTYPIGILLAGVLVLAAFATAKDTWRSAVRPAALAGGLTALGFASVLVYHSLATGHWNAFFLAHEKFGHGVHNPLNTLQHAAGGIADEHRGLSFVSDLQTVFVACTVLCMAVWAGCRWRQLRSLERMVVLYVTVVWLFPLVMRRGALTRVEALLLPALLLLPRVPEPVWPFMFLALAVFDIHVTALFFMNVLV